MDQNNPAVKRAILLSELSNINRHIRLTEYKLENESRGSDTWKITNQTLTDLKDKQQRLLGGKT